MLVSKQVLNYLANLLSSDENFSLIDSDISYSEDETGTKPIVELHISRGNFFSKGSCVIGDKIHTFNIQISVIASSAAKYDLSVIENESSTNEQRAIAIEAGQRAANNAFNIAFTVFDLVFSIINNRANQDFGMTKNTIKN